MPHTRQPIRGLAEFLVHLSTCNYDEVLDTLVFGNDAVTVNRFLVDSTEEFFDLLLVDKADYLG